METKCTHCWKSYTVSDETLWKKAKCSWCSKTFIVAKTIESWEELLETAIKNDVKKEKIISQKEENLEIKPHFASYMFLGSPALIMLVFLILASSIWALTMMSLLWGFWLILPAIFWTLLVLWFLWRLVKYKKEKYTLTDRKIIYSFGNLFSDNATEIALDRVVQVKSILWFVQYHIFKTWNIQIRTAWSSDSTVYFRNISTPKEVYEKIKSRMKKNGFHLEMNKLVQEEKPHWLGIVWEVFGKGLLWLVFFAYIIFSWYEWYQEAMDWFGSIGEDIWGMSTWAVAGWIGFGTVVLLLIAWIFALKYLDLKRRKYQIFTDTIVYKEWFLTKHHSFIPMENISDTENTQSFFSKIFGLHDVIVSSSWNNNKVSFKNMVNWEKMMENIKYLKNETVLNEKDVIEWEDENSNSLIGFKNTTEMALNFDKEFKAEFKMSTIKTLFPLFILLIPPFTPAFFVVGLMAIITIKFTTFIVWESSIEKKFGFLNTKHNTFSVEKITWVVFKESLIDKLFKTCSITFWSIWNWADITFKNIKKVDWLEENIKAKLWIQKSELVKQVESQLTFLDYIKSAIWPFIVMIGIYLFFMVALAIISTKADDLGWLDIMYWYGWVSWAFWLLLFLYILRFLYTKFYYSPVRYINKIYTDSIESIQWFFIVTKKYSLFRNVKGTKAKKYPLTMTWSLTFDIAWEQIQQNQKQKWNLMVMLISLFLKRWGWWWATTIVSNKISMKFIKDIFSTFDTTEEILNEETVETNSILTSKQDIWNSIVTYVIVAIIAIVWINLAKGIEEMPEEVSVIFNSISVIIILFFAIVIGLVVWIIKVKFYDYQKDRVLFNSGIIYKQKHSILYKKFNYVEFNQWFVNKIFKNWNIKIYTLGSWAIDMYIKDIDNYKEVYELFKKD